MENQSSHSRDGHPATVEKKGPLIVLKGEKIGDSRPADIEAERKLWQPRSRYTFVHNVEKLALEINSLARSPALRV